MKFGVTMFVTEYSIPVSELARAVEDLGFESLWLPEHTHIPASRLTPWPGGPELPKEYAHSFDPFLALTAAAAVTTTLKLGTGVCLVIEHDPITLAKQVATLDQLSNGRFLFGVGGGWNKEEMANHGTDPVRRFPILRERVLAMKALWTSEEASFRGSYVNFEKLWQWPKPVQQPHPPIIVGGNGARTLERVVEYGDGWMPIAGRPGPSIASRAAELHAMKPGVPITIFTARSEDLETYEKLGAERCILGLPAASADEVLPRLKRYAELLR